MNWSRCSVQVGVHNETGLYHAFIFDVNKNVIFKMENGSEDESTAIDELILRVKPEVANALNYPEEK